MANDKAEAEGIDLMAELKKKLSAGVEAPGCAYCMACPDPKCPAKARSADAGGPRDEIDRSSALSLADAVSNCRVTCKHEPSAFDLEQQGYDTIVNALRFYARALIRNHGVADRPQRGTEPGMNELPEGRGSLPAGALESGSPLEAASDSTPRGAALGRVVHCKRDPYDFYIGRPTKYGNPYRLVTEDHRQAVINLFERYARNRVATDRLWAEAVKKLHGKTLACYCAPKACHGDVLLKIAAELNATIDGRFPAGGKDG